jgi:CDP-diacylglycerol--glycerol-3-phosphate 3-phosphatidyltransferase
MVLDAHLSLAFLNWPLRSLNYFYLVDRAIYLWNWSPPAKALNSGALVILMLVTRSALACLALALGITCVKAVSLARLHRIGVPAPIGCASPNAS